MKHTRKFSLQKSRCQPPRRHGVQIMLAAFGCVVALAPAAAALVAPQAPAEAVKQVAPMTVLAMIKAESDVLATFEVQQKKVAARARPKPALLSIYGVLPQLRATVLVNGREVVFEQGRKHPIYPQTSAMRLRHIKPPCVSFTHHARPQTVCLSRVGS